MNRRIKKGWMKLRVQDITQETPDTVTLHFVDDETGNREFDYTAGQYLTFRFDSVSDKPVVRSYTMSSSPRCDPSDIQVTVKEISDPFISRYLVKDVKQGDILKARGPIGKFGYNDNDQPHLVMVAAGSGVTPFLSIMREYASSLGQLGSPKSMTLLVSFRTQEDIICKRHIDELNSFEGIQIITTLSRENHPQFKSGRIQEHHLKEVCEPYLDSGTFMTCGPQAIMDLTVDYLRAQGVEEDRIKTESFD